MMHQGKSSGDDPIKRPKKVAVAPGKSADLCFLLSYAWRSCKQYYVSVTLKSLFGAALPLVDIVGLGLVVDALTRGEDRAAATRLIVLFVSFNLTVAILTQIITLIDNSVMRKSSDAVQLGYMYDAVNINYHYAEDRSILNLKKKSMSGNPVWFLSDLGELLRYTVQFAGVLYLLAVLSPLFILIILATSAASVLLSFRSEKLGFALSRARAEDDRKLEYLYRTMTDYAYAKEVRINHAGPFLAGKYRKCGRGLTEKLAGHTAQTIGLGIVTAILTVVQSAAMYLYFSHQVYEGQITIAEYTVLLGATTLLISLLLGFFGTVAKIKTTLAYTELFRQYNDTVAKNSTISKSNTLPIPAPDPAPIRITFDHVSFSYPNSDRPILKDLSFSLTQGERVGLVGQNGSGKTTLIKLLCRLYDPTEGTITINGRDIKTIPHKAYTKHLGIVLQDFCLFADSVRENIVFDRTYNEKRLYASIEKSGLAEKLASMQAGVDTHMTKRFDNNGVEFSGGEGQKLALARVLYREADVLMLDEPTSALDPLAECELFTRLGQLSEGKATLFISHRLSSTKFCDRILVLEDGRITEEGNHNALMQKGGTYARLFAAQAKYYEKAGEHA